MESGREADARRANVLVRPDGSVVVPPRLARWVLGALRLDLAQRRREGGLAGDLLALLDGLARVPDTPAVGGGALGSAGRIEVGDAPDSHMGELVSTSEAADLMGMPIRTLTSNLERGTIRGYKVGRAWGVPRSSIDEYMNGRKAL